DIVSMTQAGVTPEVIATHVRNHGLVRPLTTNDIIYLQQNGVNPMVIQAAQASPGPIASTAPVATGPTYVVTPAPPPVVVVDPYCPGPHFPPPHWRHRHHHHHHGPSISWGVSLSSDHH